VATDRTSKRILTLCYEHPPLGGGGGKVARELSDRLAPQGFEIDLVTMRLPDAVQVEPVAHVTLHQVESSRKDRIVCGAGEMMPYLARSFLKAWQIVQARRPDFNLSHFLFPDGVTCLLLKKALGLPYVVTAHGSDVPGYNPHRFKLLHRLLKPVWRVVARNAAMIVCPSAVIQELVHAECPSARTTVIPNGIDPGKFVPDRPKKPRILTVARMVERKGVQYLIEALAGLDAPFELHVVGDGPYLPTLRDLAEQRRVDVVFHGALPNTSAELKELYETSRIFAFVSTMENFPLVLLEAMTAGCAIVTTSGTGCAEAVGNAAVLVPTADVEATRQALVQLMEDEALCAALGRNARARVDEQYAWDIVVRQYVEVLESMRAPAMRLQSKQSGIAAVGSTMHTKKVSTQASCADS
jgi:glycosyltransferase involved in cell wall biosynthesis